jgi:hypothetical protein
MPYKRRKEQLEAQRQAQRRHRDKMRQWFSEFMKDKSCLKCPESTKECLDFHHIDPKTKKGQVTKLLRDYRSMKKVLEEIEKCVILCANCHRKIHAGIMEL